MESSDMQMSREEYRKETKRGGRAGSIAGQNRQQEKEKKRIINKGRLGHHPIPSHPIPYPTIFQPNPYHGRKYTFVSLEVDLDSCLLR
jgi:hypothetical protein